MDILIRQETPSDHAAVGKVIQAAFRDDPHGGQTEHLLVEKLRRSPAFIPELSLVAELEGEVVGHILLTRIAIQQADQKFSAVALAPVSVSPAWQNRGIGGRLILAAHERARDLGHAIIVLLGHAAYYPRFGYEPAAKHGVSLPFDAPPENCMVLALIPNGLKGVNGVVVYPAAFYE